MSLSRRQLRAAKKADANGAPEEVSKTALKEELAEVEAELTETQRELEHERRLGRDLGDRLRSDLAETEVELVERRLQLIALGGLVAVGIAIGIFRHARR